MTPASPDLTLGRSPSTTPTATAQPHGRPSGGVHNTDQPPSYSLNEILALLGFVGYKGQNQANMAAIVMAESGGDPRAVHTNSDGSQDRGLFQINNAAHPDVSDACAFDPVCAAHAAQRIQKGSSLGAWSTWTNGSAKAWLPAAEKAQQARKWPKFQAEFAGDKLGQAGNATGNAQAGTPQARMLFNCGSQAVNVHVPIFGSVNTGLSTPDVGCYVLSAIEFTVYAVGGLILVGAGLLLIAKQNPLKVGAKGLMMTPVGRAAGIGAGASSLAQQREQRIAAGQERRLALGEAESARKAQPRPPSLTAQTAAAREARQQADLERQLAGVETKAEKARRRTQEAVGYRERAKGYRERSEGYAIRQRAKNPAGIGQGVNVGGTNYGFESLMGIAQKYQDELPDRLKE